MQDSSHDNGARRNVLHDDRTHGYDGVVPDDGALFYHRTDAKVDRFADSYSTGARRGRGDETMPSDTRIVGDVEVVQRKDVRSDRKRCNRHDIPRAELTPRQRNVVSGIHTLG